MPSAGAATTRSRQPSPLSPQRPRARPPAGRQALLHLGFECDVAGRTIVRRGDLHCAPWMTAHRFEGPLRSSLQLPRSHAGAWERGDTHVKRRRCHRICCPRNTRKHTKAGIPFRAPFPRSHGPPWECIQDAPMGVDSRAAAWGRGDARVKYRRSHRICCPRNTRKHTKAGIPFRALSCVSWGTIEGRRTVRLRIYSSNFSRSVSR